MELIAHGTLMDKIQAYSEIAADYLKEHPMIVVDTLIVVIVDELADLMAVVGKDIEILIRRLTQKSRAAGIHLIMATQRPSVDVITGVIKANLPTRISFKVTSRIDSRTILGEQGAEQLLGKGDMLYKPNTGAMIRVHGPFVSDEEVERVATHWRAQGKPDYVDAVNLTSDSVGAFGHDPNGPVIGVPGPPKGTDEKLGPVPGADQENGEQQVRAEFRHAPPPIPTPR